MGAFMEKFDSVVGFLLGIVWHDSCVWLLLGAGLLFTILTRGIQFRGLWKGIQLIIHPPKTEDEDKGISGVKALLTTVGGRVGTGNIAGVAVAISLGGPGAVFWMWMEALLGGASAFIESTLAQIYKSVDKDGQYVGGQSYYAEKALGLKWYGGFVAAIVVVANMFGNPGVQANTIASTVSTAFHIPPIVIAVVLAATLLFITFGGIRRIANANAKVVPGMCIAYLVLALILVIANITKVPAAIALIFNSALNPRSALGGLVGSALAWGVRRGVYSNEAGQGAGSAAAAAAACNHPVEQGLLQACSVFVDTIVICSITAFSIIVTGMYNVVGPDGAFIVENLPGVDAGAPYMQYALESVLPFGAVILALLLTVFAFTSLLNYYIQAETAFVYLTWKMNKNLQKTCLVVMRVFYAVCVFFGSVWPAQRIWNLSDIAGGLLTWSHLVLILIICKPALTALRDYDAQRKAGIANPTFSPAKLGIKNAEVWDNMKKAEK